MKKITSKKLLNYGAMSAALLAGANASGQIIFTDIADVDVTATGALEIDLNEDGIVDFIASAGATAAVIFAEDTNAFVGFSAGSYNYASNLAQDAIIDATSPLSPDGGRVDLNFNGCAYDNSQFCGGVTDGYAGLVFKLSGNTHYGWMRLDLSADGSGFIVKSYAFNSVPDEAITAGQTLSLEDNKIEGFSSYVSNDVLTLNARIPMESLTIHNISGQELISRKLSNSTELIDLSALSTGVYIATVSVEGKLHAITFVR
jgi:hypothetical protein